MSRRKKQRETDGLSERKGGKWDFFLLAQRPCFRKCNIVVGRYSKGTMPAERVHTHIKNSKIIPRNEINKLFILFFEGS